MDLWDLVRRSGCRSVAVFGMAKNAGKTVTLNRLADAACREGISLGLTSIGRDGEAWDVLIHRRKPSIRVGKGTLLATAEACLKAGTAGLETLEISAVTTPLGPVHITRVQHPGRVEAAGPSRIEQLREVVGRLFDLGASLVLVDGAIDRRGPASPRVTEACILATGAILSEDQGEAVRLTCERVRQINLPRAGPEDRLQWQAGRVVVRTGGRIESFAATEALKENSKIRSMIRGAEAVVLAGGALTEHFLRGLIGEHVRIVVRDPTRVFVDDGLLRQFEQAGGRLEVVEPLNLIAVTVNPVSLEGWSFDAGCFFRAVRDALPGIPVFDVTAGLGPD
ncbi:MAG: hypothetical protein R6V25_10710 [Desulfatiglandales bacterium]